MKRTIEAASPSDYVSARGTAALCPFHNEKTPSLVLWKNGTFRCFSCGAKGRWEDAEKGHVTLTRFDAGLRLV